MKMFLIVLAAMLLSACQRQIVTKTDASTPAASPVNTSRTATEVSDAKKAEGAPVEFTALGITADKANVAYRRKVNTGQMVAEAVPESAVCEVLNLGQAARDYGGRLLLRNVQTSRRIRNQGAAKREAGAHSEIHLRFRLQDRRQRHREAKQPRHAAHAHCGTNHR